MSNINGDIAFRIIGALLATIDQRDPELIDALKGTLALAADPIGQIANDAVGGIIEARQLR